MATPGTDAALRRDVRLLGETLGRVLVEQGGPGLLAAEERIRELSRNARSTGSARARDRLAESVAALPLDRQADVLRAFSLYFQLANLAEQHHRLRRRSQYEHEQRTPPESLAEALAKLERAGVTQRRLAAAARRLSLELVLTAHPTEATRPHRSRRPTAARRPARPARRPALPRSARERVEASIAEEVTALWQTDEVRSQRPRVVDEIRHGLWFFEQSLLDVAPALVGDLRRAVPAATTPLRFGSWIGGDQDGNPNSGPRTIEEALNRARLLVLERYRAEVRELAARLGVADTLVGVSPELRRSIARTSGDAGVRGAHRRTNEHEPYRRKLSLVWHRLGETIAAGRRLPLAAELARRPRARRPEPAREPRRRLADGRLAALRRRVELFGFHLAKLDVRCTRRAAPADRRDADLRRHARARSRGTARRRSTR
jgi:phosphoenolpyruvate carboxylase